MAVAERHRLTADRWALQTLHSWCMATRSAFPCGACGACCGGSTPHHTLPGGPVVALLSKTSCPPCSPLVLACSLGSKKLALTVERQKRQEQLDLGSEEEAGGQRSGPSASARSEDEEAQLLAGQADSDPDFVLEEELLPEEVEEQRWMAEQRRLRRLSASPAIGGVAKRGGRRRSGAAAAAVVVKEEQHRQRHQPAKHRQQEEVVDLLTDSDSDSGLEEHGPSARRATARPTAAACQPRTKASHPVSAHQTLRFTLAGPNGNALAEVAVRGCTPLRAIATALAARCLDGGSGTEAPQLQLCVEGSRAPLDQALTVKAAGLHDGSRILVGLPEVSW